MDLLDYIAIQISTIVLEIHDAVFIGPIFLSPFSAVILVLKNTVFNLPVPKCSKIFIE